MPGIGSQYASANLDVKGKPFDGGKVYRLRVPTNPPAKDFWSVVLYDTQTRSMLQTDQQFPGASSGTGPTKNEDGSVEVSTSTSHQRDRKVPTTGYRQYRGKAGSQSSGCMARFSHGLTSCGNCQI
jgi:hypothetical protein